MDSILKMVSFIPLGVIHRFVLSAQWKLELLSHGNETHYVDNLSSDPQPPCCRCCLLGCLRLEVKGKIIIINQYIKDAVRYNI